jgi:hypothetical protein
MTTRSAKETHSPVGTRQVNPHSLVVEFLKWAGVVLVFWLVMGALAPLLLQCTSERRGQLGDQFGAVNALFTGLALAGLLVTLRHAQTEHRDSQLREAQADARASEQLGLARDQLDSQKRAAEAELFSRSVDSLVAHARLFSETTHYRLARVLGWRCIDRAFDDLAFRASLARSHRTARSETVRPVEGWFRDPALARDGRSAALVYSWLDATLHLDDLMTFFALLAIHIERAEVLAGTSSERETNVAHLREVVRSINVYWEWWGPSLGYLDRLRTQQSDGEAAAASPQPARHHRRQFDVLDRYLLDGLPISNFAFLDDLDPVAATPRRVQMEALMRELCSYDRTWVMCDADGNSTTSVNRSPSRDLNSATLSELGLTSICRNASDSQT